MLLRQHTSYLQPEAPPQHPNLAFYNLLEVEEMAKQIVPKQNFDYIAGGGGDFAYFRCAHQMMRGLGADRQCLLPHAGAESMHTMHENRNCFSWYKLVPRVLRDCSYIDMSCSILGGFFWVGRHPAQLVVVLKLAPVSFLFVGIPSSMPVWIAPMAMVGTEPCPQSLSCSLPSGSLLECITQRSTRF